MRLTCPNCGAQYEIPDDVLPETGRDVQCSNCGDTWFQPHPDHAPAEESDPPAFGVDTPAGADADDAPYDAPEDAAQPAGDDAARDDAQDDSDDDGEPVAPAAVAAAAAARRGLDPEVSSVLREEAERERRARAREAGSLESQPDLGLDDGAGSEERRSREARARMARLRGEPVPGAGGAPDHDEIDPTSRRGLLPDIEEINSSLRSDDDRADAEDMEDSYPEASDAAQRGGFRRGFLLIVSLSVILLLLYVFAPQIGRMVPALSDVLGEYVAVVNGARLWLDGQIASLMLWLDGMSSSAPPAEGS